MGFYRQIHSRIWKDSWFHGLPQDLKLLFIYAFSNDQANLAGLYEIPVDVIACETGLSRERVREGLAQFHRQGRVLHDDGWLWVTSLLRYNASNLRSPKIQQHLRATLRDVPEGALKRRWLALNGHALGDADGEPGGPEGPGPDPRRDKGGPGPGGQPPGGFGPPGGEASGCHAATDPECGRPVATGEREAVAGPRPAVATGGADGGSAPAARPPAPEGPAIRAARRGCHAPADSLSEPHPQEQEQESEPEPEKGTTESAGADGARAPAGGSARASCGTAPQMAGGYRARGAPVPSPEVPLPNGGPGPPGRQQAAAVPTSFAGWTNLLQESDNRPATLKSMFETLFPGRSAPTYGYLGKAARAVGGAGRLAELLWQHSTRPPTGDVLAYVQGVVRRERQQIGSQPLEPAGFEGIRNWMKGEEVTWQAERRFAVAS